MTAEQTKSVIENAELAAVYFRALTDNGVPAQHAVSLTSSYVLALVVNAANGQTPREPWEGDGS